MQSTHYILHHRSGSLLFRRNKTQHYMVGYRSKSLAKTLLKKIELPPKYLLLPDNPVELHDPQTDVRLIIDTNATFFIPKSKPTGANTGAGAGAASNIPLHPVAVDGAVDGAGADPFSIQQVDYHDFLLYPVTHGMGIVMPFFLITEDEDEYVYRAHVIDPLP